MTKRGLSRIPESAAVGFALFFIFAFLFTALRRLTFPFDLEWLEGSMADMVLRVMNHQPLYAPPGLDHVPPIYPPLFFKIGACLFHIFNPGYIPLRMLSILSTLGTAWFLFITVKEKSTPLTGPAVTVGLFFACYWLSDGFYDLARVDSLSLVFLFGAFAVLRKDPFPPHRQFAAALLMVAAVYTKQTLLLPVGALTAALLLRHKSRLAPLPSLVAVITGALFLYLNHSTQGWFRQAVMVWPSQHTLLSRELILFWTRDLLPVLPVPLLLCGAYFTDRGSDPDKRRTDLIFFLGLGLTAWSSRIHSGGDLNVLMPLYGGLALVSGLAINQIQTYKNSLLKIIPGTAILIQFFLLLEMPGKWVPEPSGWRAAEQLIRDLGREPGEVLVPYHGFAAFQAGKASSAHAAWVWDLFRSDSTLARAYRGDMASAIRNKRYAAVYLDKPDYFQSVLETHYSPTPIDVGVSGALNPPNGLPYRPLIRYRPKPDSGMPQ